MTIMTDKLIPTPTLTPDLLLFNIERHVNEAMLLGESIQHWLKATEVDQDARWELFKRATSAHLLPEHDWQQDLPIFNELDVSWYDDFYEDRYATVRWVDIVEYIEENKPNKFYPHLTQIKEEIMQAGYWGFINDW